jgi:hypothetical protein
LIFPGIASDSINSKAEGGMSARFSRLSFSNFNCEKALVKVDAIKTIKVNFLNNSFMVIFLTLVIKMNNSPLPES